MSEIRIIDTAAGRACLKRTARKTLAISVLAVGNVTGRMAWGALQDRFGARPTTLLSLGLTALSLLLMLPARGQASLFLGAAGFLGFCYGGALSLYAAQAAHVYGNHVVGRVYSTAMLAHGLAAIAGPALGGLLVDATGDFTVTLLLAALVAAAGVAGYGAFTGTGHQTAQTAA